jgi:hypothetical protein
MVFDQFLTIVVLMPESESSFVKANSFSCPESERRMPESAEPAETEPLVNGIPVCSLQFDSRILCEFCGTCAVKNILCLCSQILKA